MTVVRQKRLIVRDFRTICSSGAIGGLSDGQLVERYVARREGACFEAIVHRHGPMVWGVCRRVLRDHHEAEDAFQATFLVLARKASSIVPREMVGNWLHGVAYQTAVKARAASFRRRGRERRVEMPEPEAAPRDSGDDLLPVLDQELRRLPDKYRIPVVLCDLGGKSHREAAEQLGWPIGTVSGRLSRARAMLARRMARHGSALSGGALAVLLSQSSAPADVPASLIATTIRTTNAFAAGRAAAGVVASADVADLAEGILKGMLMTKLKITAAALVAAVALWSAGAGAIGQARRAEASSPAEGRGGAKPAAGEVTTGVDADRRQGIDPSVEMKRLEGTWAITDVVEEGIVPTAEQRSKGFGRVIIKGDKLTMRTLGPSPDAVSFCFAVDPSKSPKIIGMIPLNDKMEEDASLPILLGIYELKGDTLTICTGMDRPDDFEAGPGSSRNKLVLKWAKW